MKLLRQFLGPLLALLLTFGSVVEVSAPVTVAAAGVVLGVGHAQAATPAQKAVVLNGVPSWVLRANGALPSIDMDFAHNRAWVSGSGPRAPPSLLTTTRASTGYAQWADGHLSSFAANVPRITDLGLLVEQASTNLAVKSQDQSGTANWANYWAGPTSRTANTTDVLAPDNTQTATKLVIGGSIAQPPGIQQSITGNVGSTATISTWMRGASGGEQVLFAIDDNGNKTNVTLTTSWVRYSYTGVVGAGGSEFEIRNVGSATPVGTIYTWGAQYEILGFATSYIPTTTVTVTRAADNIVLAGSALTAALAAKAALFKTNLGAGIVGVVNLGIFNGSPFQNFQFASTSTVAITNGTNFATATLGAGSYSGTVSAAFGFDSTSITAIANGGTKVTSANSWGSTSGSFSVGSNFGINHALNGYLTRLASGTIKGQFDGITAP